MSDFFGIGGAIRGAVEIYFRASRGTGRTIRMIDSLKEGDRVVFLNSDHAKHTVRMAKERGVEIDYIISAVVDAPYDLNRKGTPKGRLIFDHCWVEEFYKKVLERADKDIQFLQDEFGGYGQKHIETRELAKWHY